MLVVSMSARSSAVYKCSGWHEPSRTRPSFIFTVLNIDATIIFTVVSLPTRDDLLSSVHLHAVLIPVKAVVGSVFAATRHRPKFPRIR